MNDKNAIYKYLKIFLIFLTEANVSKDTFNKTYKQVLEIF